MAKGIKKTLNKPPFEEWWQSSKDYFSEPILEGNAEESEIKVYVNKNEREFKTWYTDVHHNFNTHAKGVATCELGAKFLEKFREFFGIEGNLMIDKSGQNIDKEKEIFDIFTGEGKKLQWVSEWKSAWTEEEDLSSCLSDAVRAFIIKDENGDLKPGSRVDAAKEKFELPEYGYAFAIRITESYVEIKWEKVKIPTG